MAPPLLPDLQPLGPRSLGLVLLFLGILFVLGALWLLFGVPIWLGWIGRLPGDLRLERHGLKVLVPITSTVILSLLLTLLLNLFRRFF